MKSRIKLTLPYPPSANELWRSAVTRSKKMPFKPVSFQYETAKSKQYKLHVSGIILAARLQGQVGPDDHLRAVVIPFPPKLKRKRDVHNLTKCLYDSIAPAMGFDDSQIVDSQVLWGEPHGKQGAAIVYLEKIENYKPVKMEGICQKT